MIRVEDRPNIIADTLASSTLSQRMLSSTMLARALADQPVEPSLVLDFARGGYGTGNRCGIMGWTAPMIRSSKGRLGYRPHHSTLPSA
jgi:hypothetical protein